MSTSEKKNKEIYYETFPLGIWSVSKPFALICLIIGILGTSFVNYWYLLAYAILYLIVLMINIKFRCNVCAYYQEFCNTKFGSWAQNIFKFLNTDKESSVLIVSLLSYVVIIFPAIGGIYVLILSLDISLNIVAIVLLAVYFISLIIPAFTLKKIFIAKYCEAK